MICSPHPDVQESRRLQALEPLVPTSLCFPWKKIDGNTRFHSAKRTRGSCRIPHDKRVPGAFLVMSLLPLGNPCPLFATDDGYAGAASLPFVYFEIVDYGIELSGHLF